MIKSVIRKSTYKAMYRLLDRVSPLEFDCGLLCGAACCRDETDEDACGSCAGSAGAEPGIYMNGQSEDICIGEENVSDSVELGMELLPGEDKIHDRQDDWLTWSEDEAEDMDYPASWRGKVYFIKCRGPEHCRRSLRPIQCRTFPLAPHLMNDGRLIMILNASDELSYDCPLTDPEMVSALNPDYIKATYTVWKRLVTDPLIYDLVEMDSSFRDTVTVVYDPDEYFRKGQMVWLG